MADVLSQKQIDRLLGKLKEKDEEKKEEKEVKSQPKEKSVEVVESDNEGRKIIKYNFRSPTKYTKDQLKIVNNMYENIIRLMCLQLSGMLRVSCDGKIVGVDEQEFKSYSENIGESSLIGLINTKSDEKSVNDKLILLQMDRPLSFCIIDRLLAGDGSCIDIKREYTEIELSILKYLFTQFMPQFKNAWVNYAVIEHEIDSMETNPKMIQSVAQEDSVILVTIELQIKNLSGNMTVCIPSESADSMIKLFESKYLKPLDKGEMKQREKIKSSIMNSLEKSKLDVCGVLGDTDLQIQELLNLQVGDILMLDGNQKNKNISLNVQGIPWFNGNMGVYKKNYAIKLDEQIKKVNYEEVDDFEFKHI